MTPKDIHKIFIPQKIFIFLKTLKGIEIQNFEPQNGASPRMNENIIVPPPPLHPLLADRNRGRGRPDSNNRKKTLIRVFFVGFFLQLYFFTVQNGRNIYRGGGGGGCNFLLLLFFFFFFFWGGGGLGGMQILISIETYITCDFSGGGGGPDHLFLSGFAHG